ncbi:hypothetical protein CRENPOLYSF1_240070 [Crenothrix polyspora]|uniref:Uncharacterized protein n=1 Tax=Crenothrix polyspora TaxID=360316 RepID=A0A1R4H804_9GAMM|nr:hypothetical protein CRENPOLYSF1_240070 [Crenothrix polyspora]
MQGNCFVRVNACETFTIRLIIYLSKNLQIIGMIKLYILLYFLACG